VTKAFSYITGGLLGLVILLGGALGVFLVPFFQADEMLAQIRVEDVVGENCYLISLELTPDNQAEKHRVLVSRQSICGDYLGLGYEFSLPEKTFAMFKKPGIVITNVVGYDKKTRNQLGNLQVGSYELAFMETVRTQIAQFLKKASVFRSVTYDVKALMLIPQKGAVISYRLEPLRQQVIAECTGCK
jgi:hypothetical protein